MWFKKHIFKDTNKNCVEEEKKIEKLLCGLSSGLNFSCFRHIFTRGGNTFGGCYNDSGYGI